MLGGSALSSLRRCSLVNWLECNAYPPTPYPPYDYQLPSTIPNPQSPIPNPQSPYTISFPNCSESRKRQDFPSSVRQLDAAVLGGKRKRFDPRERITLSWHPTGNNRNEEYMIYRIYMYEVGYT